MLVELGDLRNDGHDERAVLLLLRGRIPTAFELLEIVALLQITQILQLRDLIEVQTQIDQLLAAANLPHHFDHIVGEVQRVQIGAVLQKLEIHELVEGENQRLELVERVHEDDLLDVASVVVQELGCLVVLVFDD